MTRPFPILGLAAAVAIASLTFLASAPAEAGSGGVRLNFGGPLGTFVARPTPGYGGGSSTATHRKAKPKAHHQAKQKAVPKPKGPVIHHASHSLSKARGTAKPVRQFVRHTPVMPEAESQVTAIETTAPVTGTRSLVNGTLPAPETIETLAVQETVAAIDAPETEQMELIGETAYSNTTTSGPAAVGDCKKFIPAVGVTITVGCDE